MDATTKTLIIFNIILVVLVALFWHRCNEILMDSSRWLACHGNHQKFEYPGTDVVQSGSSVWCKGNNNTDRTCHFHNLCFSPASDRFIFLHGAESIIDGIPDDRFSPALLDLSSIPNHNTQYFHYDDMPVDGLYHFKRVVKYRGAYFIFNRFNPSNLMHVLHDDLLPVFYTLLQIGLFQPESLSSSARLLFLEGWHEEEFFEMYQWMSKGRPLLKDDLIEDEDTLVCFEDAYLGISKVTTWYQYGFELPQGALPNAQVTAKEIRIFTKAFMQSLNSFTAKVSPDRPQACLFARDNNRLILNEAEVISAIAQYTGLTTIKISLDDLFNLYPNMDDSNPNIGNSDSNMDDSNPNTDDSNPNMEDSNPNMDYRRNEYKARLTQLLQDTQRCQVVVGLHGSLLALIMFLHPGSVVLELFPYGVNPDHYTPYKSLANLPGMQLTYKAWRNTKLENTVSHPDAAPEQGGIAHLSHEEQQRIMGSKEVPHHLCCSNPEWLYRIYQDTLVDIPSFLEVLSAALRDSKTLQSDKDQISSFEKAVPGVVQNATCERTHNPSNVFGINLSWQPPWNLKFFKETEKRYEVWIQEVGHDDYKAWLLEMTEYVFTDGLDADNKYRAWVRCLAGGKVGPFAAVVLC